MYDSILTDFLKHLNALAIMDKADSVNGFSGPLFSEITKSILQIISE